MTEDGDVTDAGPFRRSALANAAKRVEWYRSMCESCGARLVRDPHSTREQPTFLAHLCARDGMLRLLRPGP